MKRIVSAVPGRLRIRDPYLSTELAVASISASLSRELPIQSMRPNLVANSIVLHYDAALIDLSAMKAVTENLLAKLMRQEAANDSSRLKRRSAKRKLNRYAKIGALSSLAASLAFAYSGPKRLHIITGWIFIACRCAHLAIFRRTLVH